MLVVTNALINSAVKAGDAASVLGTCLYTIIGIEEEEGAARLEVIWANLEHIRQF